MTAKGQDKPRLSLAPQEVKWGPQWGVMGIAAHERPLQEWLQVHVHNSSNSDAGKKPDGDRLVGARVRRGG